MNKEGGRGVETMPKEPLEEEGLAGQEKKPEEAEKIPDGSRKKESPTNDNLEKIDQIFNGALELVKNAPEVKEKALKALLEQMQQIAEQMRHVRDMRNLHELKKEMMQHWQELQELAGGDEELLTKVQKWGKGFVESKVLYYDLIDEMKVELTDTATQLQIKYQDIRTNFSLITRALWDHNIPPLGRNTMNLDEKLESKGVFGAYLSKLISSLRESEAGFESVDIDEKSGQTVIETLSQVLRDLIESANHRQLIHLPPENKKDPFGEAVNSTAIAEISEMRGWLDTTRSGIKELTEMIAAASKTFKFAKKLKDTHFLDVFNG